MKNEKFINYIYDTYSSKILNIAYTYLKSRTLAEDVLQEVLLKIIKKNIKFNSLENERNWIFKVTINLCKDVLKSSYFKKNVELTDDLMYLESEEQVVLEEVLKLPENYRNVIYMYYYEGYSLKDISKIMNKNVSTIGTWLYRAKQELKKRLGEWENE